MTTAPESEYPAGSRSGLGATLPESIPLPAARNDHLMRREAFLLLFCAVFAGAVFLLWSWINHTFLIDLTPEARRPYDNLNGILGPFLTAFLTARLYSAMVRRYERQLQRHRLLLAQILDTSADGILTLDAQDLISTWNRGAQQIFGYRGDEIIGQHAAVLYPPRQDALKEIEANQRRSRGRNVLRREIEQSGLRLSMRGFILVSLGVALVVALA